MIQGAFQHRSGRIIAFGRAVLAIFFLVIIWADKSQPALGASRTYVFLGVYALAALAYLGVTWNNWWLEVRLAAPAHVVDLLVFTSLNYATQGYTSPFFTFFVFLLLSASIRWGWRETALTAVAIILLYLMEGVTAASWGTEQFDVSRFLIRSSYLVVLSSMLILWFASNQRAARPSTPLGVDDAGAGHPHDMAAVLSFAAGRFGSRRAILVWSESEEPWTYVAELDEAGLSQARCEPKAFEPLVDPKAGEGVLIFDQARGRGLRRSGRHMTSFRLRAPLDAAFAGRFGVDRGLRIPVRSSWVEGDLFVLDVVGLCSDDLGVAEETGEQVSAALEHGELFHATEEAAAMRARLSFARDIHDSVVQFLAGLTFRMEGVRKAARAGGAIDAEIDSLQGELSREQQDLRRFIAELRSGRSPSPRTDLPASLRTLVGRMASQWGVECRLESSPESIEVPAALDQDVQQLVREAVANAVRHGRATAVEARLARQNGTLELAIADNGQGFPVRGEFESAELEARQIGPRSLHERVQNLGGTLRLASRDAGSQLLIRLPLKGD
ncbi:MAG TPA: histidine kinase [Allosphingosinicella sp.]|jgi:signal transduction histidine kinase